MHDWWIALLAKYNGDCAFINQPLLLYRQHDDNLVGVKEKKVILIFFSLCEHWSRWSKIKEQLIEFSKFTNQYNKLELKIKKYQHIGILKKILLFILK